MAIRKEDILDALGFETVGVGAWLTSALIGFGVGALVGASLGLLLAPKPGDELREDILERGRRLVHRGRARVEEGVAHAERAGRELERERERERPPIT